MTSRGYRYSPVANVALLLAVWAGSIVLLGLALRVAKVLFCFGYGCAL